MKLDQRFALLLLPIMAASVAFVFMGSAGDEAAGNESRLSVTPASGKAAVALEEGKPSALVDGSPVSLPPQLPASLDGTDPPDGWLQFDSQGGLIPTPELRALFEYYLAALGEESLGQLVARIEQALTELPEPARSQARKTLGDYLDYKLAVSELEKRSGGSGASADLDGLGRRLQAVHDLRREWLDSRTADAFFASDEALDRFQLERQQIARDDALSSDEKQAQIARAEAALPEALRESRQRTRRFQDYQQIRSELAGDPEALQLYLEASFGSEAARKLNEVEQAREAWSQRWQAYRADVARVDAAGLAGPEREAAITRLREQHFRGPERVRAEALDSLE
ncbi:lipase secretion chaperone [Marinobacter sp.]|uniref:lipase secretion chaperone n=1 Tax=Marinobacter sp. TaxID=50741 RepID=UPI00384A59FE